MDYLTVMCDAKALASAIVERQLTARDAAKTAGLAMDTFQILVHRDKKITLRTAGKLRAAFGDAVIKYMPREKKGVKKNDG